MTSGGVRNLRAMFEVKDTSTSPPVDRGRSPGASTGVASNGTSPRPLSKVRTSFVAVEKSGQVGLQMRRENSGEPSLAKRRTSFSIDEEDHPVTTAERKETIATELDARKNSLVIEETIPESAIETPSLEVDKKLEVKKEIAKSGTAKVESKKSTSSTSHGQTNGNPKPAAAKVAEKTLTRPAPISIAKTSTSVSSKRSPTKSPLPKTPTTPRGRGRPTEPAKKEPDRTKEKIPKASTASAQTSKPVNRTAPASGALVKTRIPPSPPQTGFVKPKPRSPTRPVRLPASLTAHTASSGSKTAGATAIAPTGRQSLSRASGNSQPSNSVQAHHTISRSPSRINTTTSTLKRKPSTLNKGGNRPSLGPPPSTLKKQPSRQSLPHSIAPADESFLARMMRPTTSSASKTLDKQPETPPKKAQSVKHPIISDGSPRTREVSKNPSAPLKAKHANPILTAPKKIKAKPTENKNEASEKIAEPEKVNISEPEIPEVPESIPKKGTDSVIEDISNNTAEVVTKPLETKTDGDTTVAPVKEELAASEDPAIEQASENIPEEPETAAELPEEIPTTKIEPPTPGDDSEPTLVEATVTEPQPGAAGQQDANLKEEIQEASDRAKELTEYKKELAVPASNTVICSAAPQEPQELLVETKPDSVEANTEVLEDPEDVKAREEIARLNAALESDEVD